MTLASRRVNPAPALHGVGQPDDNLTDELSLASIVLIVEDDMLLRMHAAEMIEEAGFQVIEAENADVAMGVLENRADVCIMFTDIDMPGSMNGLKLAQIVARRWPPIHILATSGHFQMHEGDLPSGGQFIAKPYRAHQIIRTLQALAAHA